MATTGPIIVTGGCGLLGFHIVQALLKDPAAGPITVVSRNPTTNIFDGVKYIAGDISDVAFLDRLFEDIKPEVIIHTASPKPTDEKVTEETFIDVNVNGTKNLVEASKKFPSVKAFVQSSTVNVITGSEHIMIKEDARPYWTLKDKAIPYWRSKAEAEKLVLAANSDKLKTVALRPCMIIGLQEYALIPAQLDALAQGKTNIQLGNNKNIFDTVSAENAATAHLLAMHALLDPSKANGKVDGEAFNITDDNGIPFWDVARIIWRTAGDKTDIKDVKVIPGWAANAMAVVGELAYGLFFFGNKSPELNRHVVNFCTCNYTYDISKAKKILGYNPVKRTEENIKEATEWELNRRKEKENGSAPAADGAAKAEVAA